MYPLKKALSSDQVQIKHKYNFRETVGYILFMHNSDEGLETNFQGLDLRLVMTWSRSRTF